jgi:hypothetical protein
MTRRGGSSSVCPATGLKCDDEIHFTVVSWRENEAYIYIDLVVNSMA